MSLKSKQEAVRLANEERAGAHIRRYEISDAGEEGYASLRAFARYIEANPAISVEDRARARELVAQGFSDWPDPDDDERDVLRLLRLIAGPEEVDPLIDLARAICDGYSNGNLQWENASESERDRCLYAARAVQAGYDIVKRESV